MSDQQQIFLDNFEVRVMKYNYIVNGNKTIETKYSLNGVEIDSSEITDDNVNDSLKIEQVERIIGDSIDFGWIVKHKSSEHSKNFYVAYAVADTSLTPTQHAQEAWKLRESEIMTWANSVLAQNVNSILNQPFNPFG
jgi:hypothetical protein